MENRKAKLNVKLDNLRRQALEKAAISPPQVANKLTFNAKLLPSRHDFDSDFELLCRLDGNNNSEYPETAKLIEDMRQTRKDIHNLEFEEEQGGPNVTMTC